MRKLWIVGVSALAVTLIAASARLIWAGGPVISKLGISDPDPGYGRTTIIAANKNPNGPASVNAVHYFMGGSGPVVGSVTKALGSNGRSDIFELPSALYQDWRGTIDMESDQPLATVSQIAFSQNAGGSTIAAAAYEGVTIGATTIYFPWVVYEENLQFTQILVMNIGNIPTALRFEYFEDAGENPPPALVVDTSMLLGYPGTPVPDANLLGAFEEKVFDMRISGTMVPELTPGTITKWQGGVKVISLNGQPLAGVATNYWSNRATAYNGVINGSDANYVPSLERRVGANAFSAIRIQCILSDSDGDCDASIQFVPPINGAQTPITCSIVQNRAKEINTDPTVATPCGTVPSGSDWVGAAIVKVTDFSQVGAIGYTTRTSSGMAQATNAIPRENARKRVFLPDISCKVLASGYEKYSLISIQNTSGTSSANVTTYFLGRGGAPDVQLSVSIPASTAIRYNLRNCTPLGSGISTWAGSARVDSDQSVAVVVENLWLESNKNWMSSYTGIPCTETLCP